MTRPANFEITRREDPHTVTLVIVGELDMSTIAQLSARAEEQIRNGTSDLTIDLREVSFMDSTGLRVLIELYDRSRHDGWRLHLTPPRHEAATLVLRVTGADQALPFRTVFGL